MITPNDKINVISFLVRLGSVFQYPIVSPPVKNKINRQIIVAGNKNIMLNAKLSPAQ